MRRIYFLLVLLTVMIFANAKDCLSTTDVADMYQAESFLSDYLNMLESGSISGIIGLLTGPMLERKESLLRKNPKYTSFLKKRYTNSHCVIMDYKIIDTVTSVVSVVITLNTQEEIGIRFTLKIAENKFKIYAEEEIRGQ